MENIDENLTSARPNRGVVAQDQEEDRSYIGAGRYWDWLPTHEGAVRRSAIETMRVQRIEGSFENGSTFAWIVQVFTNGSSDPISLRPVFLDADLLCEWVDKVFLGTCLSLIPNRELEEAIAAQRQNVGQALSARGTRVAGAIRTVSDGLLAAAPYEPVHGGVPDPKVGGPHAS